jgi:hypothetical protein
MQRRTATQGILFLAGKQRFLADIARVAVLCRAWLNGATVVNTRDISPYLWLPLSDLSQDESHRVETQLLQRLGRDGDSTPEQLVARRLSPTMTHQLIHTRIRLHESLASRDFAYLLPRLAIFHLLHGFLWATVIGSYAFAGA